MRGTKGFVAAIAAVAVAAGITAGCGTEKRADAAEIIAAAADATAKASTARMAMDMDVAASGESQTIHVDAALDLKTNDMDMTMDMSSLGLSGGDGTIEMRVVDGVMYMGLGALMNGSGEDVPPALEGKRWISMDMSQFTAQGGLATDPESFTNGLQYLRGVDKNGIDEVGHEKIRGADTTHYKAEIDLELLRQRIDDQKGMTSTMRRLMEKSLEQFTGKTLPVDVWVDGDGRVRREQMAMPMEVAGKPTTTDMTVEFYDFGAKVDVGKPPADEVAGFGDLMGSMSGGAGRGSGT